MFRKWTVAQSGSESTYILVSLVPDETIFWMRSWPSSVLSSPSCLVSSSLFLDHNWPALTLPEDFEILVSQVVREKLQVLTTIVFRVDGRGAAAGTEGCWEMMQSSNGQ